MLAAEIDLLDGTLRHASASKDAKIGGELLFEIEPEPVLGSKTANGAGCRRLTGGRAQRNRVEIGPQIAAGQPIQEFKLTGLVPHLMPLLQFGHELPLAEAV